MDYEHVFLAVGERACDIYYSSRDPFATAKELGLLPKTRNVTMLMSILRRRGVNIETDTEGAVRLWMALDFLISQSEMMVAWLLRIG